LISLSFNFGQDNFDEININPSVCGKRLINTTSIRRQKRIVGGIPSLRGDWGMFF
jgi:hypothetical protein